MSETLIATIRNSVQSKIDLIYDPKGWLFADGKTSPVIELRLWRVDGEVKGIRLNPGEAKLLMEALQKVINS